MTLPKRSQFDDILAPLLVIWMGVYPTSFLRPIQASVDHLVQQFSVATRAAGVRQASLQ
jgi:NADH:ubiquinone oxidoreductase subunit 4 (subunit M)